MYKKFALSFAVLFILAAPMFFSNSNAFAGRKLVGDGEWVHCTPCNNIDCICDPGEEPGVGGRSAAPTKEGGEVGIVLVMLALTFGTLAWRWR